MFNTLLCEISCIIWDENAFNQYFNSFWNSLRNSFWNKKHNKMMFFIYARNGPMSFWHEFEFMKIEFRCMPKIHRPISGLYQKIFFFLFSIESTILDYNTLRASDEIFRQIAMGGHCLIFSWKCYFLGFGGP